MVVAMKVTVSFAHGDDKAKNMVLKLKLPRKWKEGPTSNIKSTFLDNYNKKHPEAALSADTTHLVNKQGNAVADADIVARVFKHGETIEVREGAPPKDLAAPVKPHRVATKKAIEEAVEQSKLAFDYSKWDRLDLSDEDGDDCHPNIDKASWVKLKARQRKERREKEDIKIGKMKAKIEKYEKKTKDIQGKIDGGDDTPQLLVDLEDAQSSLQKYQAKLDKFLATRKWTADDVCDVADDGSSIAKSATFETPATNTDGMSPEEEASSYDDYVKKYRPMLDTYATIKRPEDAKDFIEANHQILNPHAEGYLLLLCLDMYMKNETAEVRGEDMDAREYNIARLHMYVHYIMELASSMRRHPREAVIPFFRKTIGGADEQVQGFEDDLRGFIARIKNRAKEKIAAGEASPIDLHDTLDSKKKEEEEDEYEPAPLGPGGLDPTEVLRSLPEDMQQAFINQDTPKLKASLQAMSEKDAAYHMQRCIDSGLWVPGPDDE